MATVTQEDKETILKRYGPNSHNYLLVALFTVVGIGSLKKITLNILFQGLEKILLVADIDVENGEWLFTWIPSMLLEHHHHLIIIFNIIMNIIIIIITATLSYHLQNHHYHNHPDLHLINNIFTINYNSIQYHHVCSDCSNVYNASQRCKTWLSIRCKHVWLKITWKCFLHFLRQKYFPNGRLFQKDGPVH